MRRPTLTPTKKARIRLWVRALRSGKYEQTTGSLKDLNGYCCLGVACDVYRKATGKGSWEEETFMTTDGRDGGEMPATVAEWFGLKANPTLRVSAKEKREHRIDDNDQEATGLNDDYHFGFPAIARAVYRTYLAPLSKAKR